MRKEILDSKNQYLEEIFKYLKQYFSQDRKFWTWENFYPILEDLIFDSLLETYSITISAVKRIYDIQFNEIIDENTIKNLIYSEDGKTLNERIKNHYENSINRPNSLEYMYNRIILIMDTETLYASNHVIHGKLYRHASHVEVIGSPECEVENGGLCEFYTSKGKMPIEELDELPPYHPDCECEVIYYLEKKERTI